MNYDTWLERQRERHEAPDGYCRMCGAPAESVHRWKGRDWRFCVDCDQEPPDDDE